MRLVKVLIAASMLEGVLIDANKEVSLEINVE
jgi:hypothetical protein